MTTEPVHPTKSSSPFLSVFKKKKPSPVPSESDSEKKNGKSPKSPQISFTQRVKMHKDLRDGKIPDLLYNNPSMVPSTSLAPFPLFKKDESSKLKKNKAFSDDAINYQDSDYLTEALAAIGDEQPIVARSIPKHAVIENNPELSQKRLRQNCIYEPEVYDQMLAESLAVCDMLQLHLDECISTTRAKSPSPGSPFRMTQSQIQSSSTGSPSLGSPFRISQAPVKKPPPVPPKPSKQKKLAFAV
ncbi:hypothetical protein FO519_008815 [Halicephalobus sp. NKZ332]|nr:hypothetical protein FO519_008815 [Halicephalobus sp. NKZ332]